MNDELSSTARARQAESSQRYLAFQLGKEQYALPLLQVKEVLEMSEPTPLPLMPAYFLGVINLRGRVISIVDLRMKLQLPKIENNPKTAIIILDLGDQASLGVVVDRVNSVLPFHPEEMSSAPEALASSQRQYLSGVAKKDSKLTLLLDVRAALEPLNLGNLPSTNKASAA